MFCQRIKYDGGESLEYPSQNSGSLVLDASGDIGYVTDLKYVKTKNKSK